MIYSFAFPTYFFFALRTLNFFNIFIRLLNYSLTIIIRTPKKQRITQNPLTKILITKLYIAFIKAILAHFMLNIILINKHFIFLFLNLTFNTFHIFNRHLFFFGFFMIYISINFFNFFIFFYIFKFIKVNFYLK